MYADKRKSLFQGRTIIYIGAYRPPSMTDEVFEADITLGFDKISKEYDNYVVLGDLK